MSQKAEKPQLSGTRLKTRKRDEKEKYDPTAFRDSIVAGLGECGNNLDNVSRYLDKEGSRLDYRRYAEVLFDILFAGGILAPGGFILESVDPNKPARSDICVFRWNGDVDNLKKFYDVFYKLIRRYKYLEKAFEDDLKKILMFQKGFSLEEREKLAKVTGIILANGQLCTPNILLSLFEDHLVKEGISAEFAAIMFEIWLDEKDINAISSTLKRKGLNARLLELFPQNKRSKEAFATFFRDRNLGKIADMHTAQMASKAKKEAQKSLADMISNENSIPDMVEFVTDLIEKQGMSETEVTISIWNSIMSAVEWSNKKEDLLADLALKHLHQYCPLLKETATTGRAELDLMLKVQEYCYENMNFLKSFQKIVLLLYKTDVISEDVILKWYRGAMSPKGKSHFLEQMKKLVEWLESAEEESEEEDGEEAKNND